MTQPSTQTGQCLCGAVTFSAENVEQHIHACHCSMCRKWSGSPAMAAGVGSVSFNGEDSITRYDSSEWAERGFCKQCGTNLFYHFKDAGQYIMWTGAFDDPSAFTLTGEIYIDEKPQGYDFAGDHPRLTGAEFMASMGVPES